MNVHRYILEPYDGMSTRYHCPSCKQREKTFTRYIDTATGKHLHPGVGRCNRESKCGYHYTPKQYFQDNDINDITPPEAHRIATAAPKPKAISFIPIEVFKASLNPSAYNNNCFVSYLINLFGVDVAGKAISQYFVGTSNYWDGATVFWQIDTMGRLRTGKIMLYNPITGKRIKEPFNHISWVHKSTKQPNFVLGQCLFGEHLLNDRTKPVAIVESEKTAVIASVYLPSFIWVAVGSLTNLNAEKCNILKGRAITLFPDLKGYDKWSSKANELSHLATFTVSDLLERRATDTERERGLDLADYLCKFSYKDFVLPEPEQPAPVVKPVEQSIEPKPKAVVSMQWENRYSKSESWEQDINELEKYFKAVSMPAKPVKLNQCSSIINIPLFIVSHLAIVKRNNGRIVFLPYLNRLKELKLLLENDCDR